MTDIVPIGGFPSIIPKELYKKIEKETKRGKEDTSNKKLSISQILEESNKEQFLIGGEESEIKII